MKKIIAFSSIRSDYDLMSKLYRLLNADPEIDLRLIVSGAHLSKAYGYTVEQVKADGLKILAALHTLVDADSKAARIKTASRLLDKAIDIAARFKPDLVICAGDREDMMIAALISGYLQIPCLHFFGGDHTADGNIDNPVRHAISKLASVHMVSTEEHKRRLISMGEQEKRIFVIGSIALDKFRDHHMDRNINWKASLGIKQGFSSFALVIFHSMVGEERQAPKYFQNILTVLKAKNIKAFVSYPNTDPGNKKLIAIIEKHKNNKHFFFYKNLSRQVFLNIYKQSLFIIGNSSSGILEAASIPIPAVNVGLRQISRKSGRNVLFCSGNSTQINKAITKVMQPAFRRRVKRIRNFYGDGKSSGRAYAIIKKYDFKKFVLKTEDPLRKVKK